MRRPVEFTPADLAAVSSVSKQLRAKYRDYVEYADIQQELYVWLIQRYGKVTAWREEYDEKHADNMLRKALRNAGEKFCRKEKAHLCGYEPEDEFFYSIPLVADMLEVMFDPDWREPRGPRFDSGSSNRKPPQEGWNLPAMVADVSSAYEQMGAGDQYLLEFVYGGERPVREALDFLAGEWGISYKAADMRVRRVLGRLRAKLGGPAPYNEEDQ